VKVVVTGAAGFAGSHVAETLLDRGHDVVGVDAFIPYYPRSVKEANLEVACRHPRYTFVEADLRTAPLNHLLAGADAVVHLAAMPGLMRSWSNFELYAECNLVATYQLLKACRDERVGKLVAISTSSVYGENAVGDETLPTRPVSPYGITKLAAEQLVWTFHEQFGVPATILRYFSLYGPRQRPDMAYHVFAEAMLDGREIVVCDDGLQTRSSTYIDDAVAGTVLAVEKAATGEVFNIGGGHPVSLLECIDVIAKATGTCPKIVHGERRPGDQRHTAADVTKAQRAFGYVATTPVSVGLVEQVNWHVARRAIPAGEGLHHAA